MNIYDFLDVFEQQKLYLIRALETNNSLYLPIQQPMKKLSLSKFKMQNLIEGVNQDLAAYVNKDIQIKNETQNFISCPEITETVVATLQMFYLESSYKFLFLQDLLFETTTITAFAEKHFISESKAYSVQKEVAHILKVYGITIKGGYLKGDEWQLRNMYFELYFKGFHGLKYPFPRFESIQNLYKRLQESLNMNLAPTQQIKFSLFLSIQYFRTENQNFIGEYGKLSQNNAEYLTDLKELLNADFSIEETHLNNECHYLITFLLSEKFVPLSNNSLPEKELRQTEHFLSQFEQKITKVLPSLKENRANLDYLFAELQDEINRIHLKWEYFPPIANTFTSKEQLRYFQEVFPEYYNFVYSYMDKHVNFKSERSYFMLFYDYLFALITTIPVELLAKPIHICIDFSRGKLYSSYIASNVLQFEAMNIVLQDKPTCDTDLYISDFALISLPCKQIIWKEPPANTDWKHFGNQLVAIRAEHLYG